MLTLTDLQSPFKRRYGGRCMGRVGGAAAPGAITLLPQAIVTHAALVRRVILIYNRRPGRPIVPWDGRSRKR